MNLFQIPLALVLFAQTPSPAELPSPPAAIPLQPAPAAVVPEAPASPPQFESISPAFPARPQAPAQTGESVETPEQEATPRSRNAGPQPSSDKPADSAVVQAAAQQEAAVASLPQQLWQTAIEQVDAAAFDAEPRSLLNTLRAFGDTASQTEAVKAYWRLSGAIVKLSFAEEEAAVLGQAREPQLPHEKALLAAARATALARQQECQLAVTLAQHELAERSAGPSAMAWPTDAPLMAAYRTNFEALFANRSAPASLVKIHKTLPTVLSGPGRARCRRRRPSRSGATDVPSLCGRPGGVEGVAGNRRRVARRTNGFRAGCTAIQRADCRLCTGCCVSGNRPHHRGIHADRCQANTATSPPSG